MAKRQAIRRVLKRAGLPYVRFHDLRHTFATLFECVEALHTFAEIV